MNIKHSIGRAICALAMFCTLSVSASDDSASEQGTAIARLVSLLTPLQSMTGDFEQVQKDPDGAEMSRASGTFTMARPERLRWETLEPFPQLLVTDGATLWLYDPDLEQVTVSGLDDQINQTPAVVFSGDLSAIDERFTVTAEGDTFTLIPKQEDGLFQHLELSFSDQQLAGMAIADGFGQRTEFHFADVEENTSPASDTFMFTPPEGTDVVRRE